MTSKRKVLDRLAQIEEPVQEIHNILSVMHSTDSVAEQGVLEAIQFQVQAIIRNVTKLQAGLIRRKEPVTHLAHIEQQINKWTWLTLAWLPEDSPEDYPEDPDNYQISQAMTQALSKTKTLTIEYIREHYDDLITLTPSTRASDEVWDALEEKIFYLGNYGQTDTASREAYMYALDKLFEI